MASLIEMSTHKLPAIETGDAGIILKADGTFQVFNTEPIIDPENLTDSQLELGKKIMGLSAALRMPAIMEILINLANDPNIFDQAVGYKKSS